MWGINSISHDPVNLAQVPNFQSSDNQLFKAEILKGLNMNNPGYNPVKRPKGLFQP